jgi:hypothetical protein
MKKTHRVTFIREEKSIHFRTSQDQYNDVQNDFDKSAYTKSSRKRTKLNMLRCFEWADEIISGISGTFALMTSKKKKNIDYEAKVRFYWRVNRQRSWNV